MSIIRKAKTLVGLAIDVSGSMKTSICNEADGQLTRFESFQKALERLLSEACEALKIKKDKAEYNASLDMFVYCFGLKDDAIEVSDLLSLMKTGDKSIQEARQLEEKYQEIEIRQKRSQDPFQELEGIAKRYGRDGWGDWARDAFSPEQAQALAEQLRDPDNANQMADYLPGGLAGSIAKSTAQSLNSFGLGVVAELGGKATGITAKLERAERFAKKLIQEKGVDARLSTKEEIRQRVSRRLRQQLDIIGDTTLSIGEVTDLWSQNNIFLQDFEDMIYGGTPMCKVLRAIKARFEREVLAYNGLSDTSLDLVLFLLSDGQPTDGTPLPIVEELKSMGVSIICCLIDSEDVSDPQVLFNQPDSSWHQNAQLMFEMSSEIEEKSHFANFLLKKNWTINSPAKLFVQLNHSKALEEFIQIILSPLGQEISEDLPRGDQ
jgi:uncharacterized protein YegL